MINKEQSQSAELLTILHEIGILRAEVSRLNAVVASMKPQRLRQFKTHDIADFKTAELSIVRRMQTVARVIVSITADSQSVTTLDAGGNEIPHLCGPFAKVVHAVQDAAPRQLKWETEYPTSLLAPPQAV
jgi:hypothetical protein